MTFNRRAFFSTLLAPLAAKLGLAKAVSNVGHAAETSKPPVPMAHVSEIGEWVDFGSHTKILKELWIDAPKRGRLFVAIGDGPFKEVPIPYEHGQLPFKILRLELPPWQQEKTKKITIQSDGEPFKIFGKHELPQYVKEWHDSQSA